MSNKNETLLRQWIILQNIPVFPYKITATDLTSRLRKEGFDISKRSVERNLQTLSQIFPLQSDERVRPYGWSWSRDANMFSIPTMSPVQALTLSLARDQLTSLLPVSLMKTLAPYFKCADNVLLNGESAKNMADWRDKVAIVSSNQPLIPPEYDENIVETVHEALLAERQLEIDYARPGVDDVKTHIIHPLGLVQRGAVIYLVVTMYSYNDIRILALHRVRSANMLDEPSRVPEGFCLGEYIAGGAFGFAENNTLIPLVVRLDAAAAAHLRETPLSEDQELVDEGETVCIRATVFDSPQLRWWLRAFGDQAEVLEPLSLRAEFAEMVGMMRKLYR